VVPKVVQKGLRIVHKLLYYVHV